VGTSIFDFNEVISSSTLGSLVRTMTWLLRLSYNCHIDRVVFWPRLLSASELNAAQSGALWMKLIRHSRESWSAVRSLSSCGPAGCWVGACCRKNHSIHLKELLLLVEVELEAPLETLYWVYGSALEKD